MLRGYCREKEEIPLSSRVFLHWSKVDENDGEETYQEQRTGRTESFSCSACCQQWSSDILTQSRLRQINISWFVMVYFEKFQ